MINKINKEYLIAYIICIILSILLEYSLNMLFDPQINKSLLLFYTIQSLIEEYINNLNENILYTS